MLRGRCRQRICLQGNGNALPFKHDTHFGSRSQPDRTEPDYGPCPHPEGTTVEGGRSRLKFQILPGTGQVMVVSADPDPMDTDTILAPFLRSLAGDMKKNPRRIKPFPVKLIERARNVVAEVDVDLDAPLTGED